MSVKTAALLVFLLILSYATKIAPTKMYLFAYYTTKNVDPLFLHSND